MFRDLPELTFADFVEANIAHSFNWIHFEVRL